VFLVIGERVARPIVKALQRRDRMKTQFLTIVAALSVPTMAIAQDAAAPPPPPGYTDQAYADEVHADQAGADRGYYDDGRAPPPAQDYRGQDRSYYQDCKRSSGTTGMLAGAGGGGLLAGVLGASPLGIAASVVGGGVLGRHLDKKHDEAQNDKNGC
jgi:hypothetical protein